MNPRLAKLPPYYFVQLEQKKNELRKKGLTVFDFSIGDPDMPPPAMLVDFLREELGKKVHNYSSTRGELALRESFAQWYMTRYGVRIDPERELVSCVGTKEGIYHSLFAFCEEGSGVLIPEPGYPVYTSSAVISGCRPHYMPLKEDNSFLPDLSSIPAGVADSAKVMFLNYPNNPTSATATMSFYKEAVDWARKNGVYIIQDAAYQDITQSAPVSIMQVDGAKEVAMEFYSFSKLFNITGWRLGFALGNAGLISALHKVKSNADSGPFIAVQNAVARFLPLSRQFVADLNEKYMRRRKIFTAALERLGHKYHNSGATFYLWWKVPDGEGTSMEYSMKLLNEKKMLVIPGSAFGASGEGYLRVSLTCPDSDIQRAVETL